jgi:hypothetical protein
MIKCLFKSSARKVDGYAGTAVPVLKIYLYNRVMLIQEAKKTSQKTCPDLSGNDAESSSWTAMTTVETTPHFSPKKRCGIEFFHLKKQFHEI